ncbi:MAG: F0F1 ATP synthase subunit A [Akkermansiaceae bacterium]|nr:F0F1 ATP synthase subunit A [Verrucomicrobiae bacterium]MCP5554377.1 F0F1 ATP synthase subunit A [Akkermansiaceae bacterium]
MNFAQTLTQSGLNAFLASGGIAPDPLSGWFTNSMLVALVVMAVVLVFVKLATSNMSIIPNRKQNLLEFIFEFLYGQVEGVVGSKLAPKSFPILFTIFVFILTANWMGLIPGVGTVGFGKGSGFLTIDESDAHAEFHPLLRPATADLNMTFALAAVFMIVWIWIVVSEVGVKGFLDHTFGPKGGLTGFMKWALVPVFLFVGVIEVISIAFRPVTLSLRLLGNIFAGETLLHTMGHLGEILGFPDWLSMIGGVVFPLPFYFMEILVGLLQAVVFTLLCAVYIQVGASHDEEEHH